MIAVKIYWQDLNESAKERILNVFGENNNWDVCPIADLEIEDERDYTIDSFLGDHEGV